MLRIEMLPAGHGDCLWVEWGDGAPRRRMLVDGGTAGSFPALRARLRALPAGERRLELLVVTHVDADHIAGVLKLLAAPDLGLSVGEVWFNGYRHLLEGPFEPFGPVQGEKLTQQILDAGLPWNAAFGGGAVALDAAGPPPEHELDGGLTLTVLGPTRAKLAALEPEWAAACEAAGIDPSKPEPGPPAPPGFEPMGPLDVDALAEAPFDEDGAKPNGSSIVLLVRHGDRRLLLAGDAHPGTIVAGLDRLGSGPTRLDAFKLPHHGSKANVDRELLERVDCRRYLVSTSGAVFGHPDREAVARVIKFGGPTPTLCFNFTSAKNRVWDDDTLRADHGYETVYPETGEEGLAVEL